MTFAKHLPVGILAAVAAACLSACATVVPPPVTRAVVEVDPFDPTVARGLPSFLSWAAEAPSLVIVDKEARVLGLYHHGHRAKTYPVVLGRSPGRKLYEGDRRTPSGVYEIFKKRRHVRFHRFLDIDYPNPEDLAIYRTSLAGGEIPRNGRRPTGPGGLLGLHGSEEDELTRVGVNWTYGCIALTNADIEEVYERVDEGTIVVILDGAEETVDGRLTAASPNG